MSDDKILIFGAGGHAKVVIDAVEREGKYKIALLADADQSLYGTTLFGYLIASQEEGLSASKIGVSRAFVAIGGNAVRSRIADMVIGAGFSLVAVVHPGAIVSGRARIGCGSLVMPGAVVNADAVVGSNVIINTGAVIEHDCEIGDGVHIAPNATICGASKVGARTLIGAGAVVLPGISVGSEVVIGAGSTVVSNIPNGRRGVGSPCHLLGMDI